MKKNLLVKALLFLLIIGTHGLVAQTLNTDKLKGMKARSIGPAGMSGRVVAIDVVRSNPAIIYIGSASGGVWKSTNGGIQWSPIFDEQTTAAIGAIAINQQNPDVIWVATGEGNPRNSQNMGNGVYKSLDGGKTWKHLGLENTRNIHRLLLHPNNPDIAYAGVQGSAFGDHADRGVFKTTDGGKTWRKVLYVNEKTGIGELVIDPQNPDKLFANMWEFHRDAWFFKSGGKGSGLHVSNDGGETWKQRTSDDGLPEGELGRMGLAVAASNNNIVYALIEAKKNALYRSEDGGIKWKKVTDRNIGDRPFYYAELYVDPKNENRLYNVFSRVSVSEDGGKTFNELLPYERIHPDHHAWYINPENPDFIIDGNDGGVAITRDRGKNWQFAEGLPLGQFYHINADNEQPYNIYGGLQDNGSWKFPAYSWQDGGLRNHQAQMLSFGDGFDVVPDRSNNRYGYSMSQGGNLVRYDVLTAYTKFIKPTHPTDDKLRYNWNAGIAADPFDDKTIYYGSQYVHKSTNRGDSWEIISPDLTTNDTSKQHADQSGGLTFDATNAENYTTIMTIAPSPKQQGVLWVGTDDGNLQVTQDGGKTWANVIKNIKGIPANTWITQIQASTYNAGEAVVVFDNHRRNDHAVYVYRTKDFGKTFEKLVNAPKDMSYALCFVQDIVQANLMFLGTDNGLYVSIDDGKNWTKWKSGMPTTSVMDLVIQPREHDVVIGTFGRSVYVLDDIRPLRALAKDGAATLDKTLKIFEAPDAVMAEIASPLGVLFGAEGVFQGENRAFGARISFVLNPQPKKDAKPTDKTPKTDSVKVEILNAAREVIRTFKAAGEAGINRTIWRLDAKGIRFPSQPKPAPNAPERGGSPIVAGKYMIRMTYRDSKDSTYINVLQDPRLTMSDNVVQAKLAQLKTMQKLISTTTEGMDRLRDAKDKIAMINRQMGSREDDKTKEVKKQGKELEEKIKKLRLTVESDSEQQGIVRSADVLGSKLSTMFSYAGSYDAPGQADAVVMKAAETGVKEFTAKVNEFFEKDYAAFRKAVESAEIKLFEEYKPLKID